MDNKIFLLLLGMAIPMEGMERPRKPVKRKLEDEFGLEVKGAPSAALASPEKGYNTAPDTISSPDLNKLKIRAQNGIFPVSIHNMTKKPVIVTYNNSKGVQARFLPSAQVDFLKALLNDDVAFTEMPIVIAPTGEDFLELSLSQNKQKIDIKLYDQGDRKFVLKGDFPIKNGRIMLRLKPKIGDDLAQTVSTDLELVEN